VTSKREKELARQRAARQAARRQERDRRRKQRNAVLASVLAVLLVAGAVAAAAVATRDSDPDDVLATGDATSSPSASAEPTGPAEQTPSAEPAVQPVTVGPCTYTPEGEPSKTATPPTEQDIVTDGARTATIATDQGDLTVELLAAQAPCTVGSFSSLARQGFYDDSPCHRLTTEEQGIFVLQCGDPTGTGRGGAGYVMAEENLEGATYPRGTVAAAKRPTPGTTGSQFFLVYQDTPLPPEYTPFGRITGGLEVLDAIAAAGAEPPNEVGTTAPKQKVQITSVTVS
jgi:peptidyl-prolyl cis-trans isomerase B (cyclophilin B)